MQLIAAETQLVGHLADVRDTAQVRGEALLGGFELAGQAPDRTGRPVGGTDGVDDRSADALGSEPLERDTLGLVEPLRRLDQAERSGAIRA